MKLFEDESMKGVFGHINVYLTGLWRKQHCKELHTREIGSDVSGYVNRCLTEVRSINPFKDSLYGDLCI